MFNSTSSSIISILAILICVPIGIYFAGIPLQVKAMTKQQNVTQQALSVLSFAMIIVAFLCRMQLLSWIMIFSICVGMIIGKISPVHRALLKKFPNVFLPKNDERRSVAHASNTHENVTSVSDTHVSVAHGNKKSKR